jgi:Fic family protein
MPTWNVSFDLRVDSNSGELQSLLAVTRTQARLVAGIPLPPSARWKIDALHIVRAVRGTTGIEGAAVSEEEVSRIIAALPGETVLPASRHREELEVRNAEAVMRFVASTDEATITEDVIRRIHTLVTQGIPYEHNEPGIYRSHPAQAGDYIPPRTNQDVRDLMAKFVEWMNSPAVLAWDPVVRAVAAHFYLISIHPFGDGNGRTSRALESLIMYRGGINVVGFYSLSNYYYEHRVEYVQMLDHVRFRTEGDMTPFLLFAVKGLNQELEGVMSTVVDALRTVAFRDYGRERLLGPDGPGQKVGMRQFELLSFILDFPEFRPSTSGDIAKGLGKTYRRLTYRTIQRDLAALIDKGLIRLERLDFKPNLNAMDEFTARGLALRSLHGPSSPSPARVPPGRGSG